MGYMNSYKQLDNLCRDCGYINGISDYIEDMERVYDGYMVPGWQEDYQKLKHYRWVRNQIAHANDADEDNMCTEEDTDWIEDFRQRILDQTDPLTQYHRAKTAKKQEHTPTSASVIYQSNDHSSRPRNPKAQPVGCAIYTLMALAVTILICFFFNL